MNTLQQIIFKIKQFTSPPSNSNEKSVFFKSILTLFTGNAIAFIIPVLLYPILSRIYAPQDYALFGLYFSVFGFLEIASAGRYDFAVVMPEHDDDAVNLIAGGLLIAGLYSLLILILVLLFRNPVALLLNNPALANWFFLLPPVLFLVSVSKLFNGWLIRLKKFKASSLNRASQKIAESSTQLALGVVKGANGLILGDFVGRLFNAVLSIFQSLKAGFGKNKILKTSVKANLRRYSEFPKFSILPSMLNALGGMLPVFIISAYYSMEVSGSFNFSRIILSVPFALISAGISQALMQQISEKRHKNQTIFHDLFSLTLKLSALSAVGVFVLYLTGPALFEFIFGQKWRESGEYTSILIFSYAVSFVVSPFSVLLLILGKIRWASFWQTFYFFSISTLWFFREVSIEHFLIVLVIIDLVAYLNYGLLIYKTVRNYENGLVQQSL